MPETKTLKRFNIVQAENGFSLHVEDDAGAVLELAASRDQLDVIADKIDEMLSESEADDEVED